MIRSVGLSRGTATPVAAAACAMVLVASPFLPWFATEIGPPFAPESTSGWNGTGIAKIVLGLGVVALLASVALALEALGHVSLEDRAALSASWIATGASGAALCLVGYRLAILPEPAEFLSRAVGMYVAAGAAAGCAVLSGLQISPRAADAARR